MINRPSGAEIAVALGISTPRVSQLKRRGMPVDSVEAAAAWYRSRVDQVRAAGQRLSRGGGAVAAAESLPAASPPEHDAALSERLVRAAEALAESVAGAIGRPEFDTVSLPLRLILQEIPARHRHLVALDAALWTALCRPVLDAVRAGGDWDQPATRPAPVTAADAAELSSFWYQVAACEVWLSDAPSPVERALAGEDGGDDA